MKLIVGGAHQGKARYASSIGIAKEESMEDGAVCSLDALFTCSCMNHFHLWVKRALKEGRELRELPLQLARRNPEVVLITDELGCGIVPVDAFDREYREVHGRICCSLAAEAREVHRVLCGIGTVIKHG